MNTLRQTPSGLPESVCHLLCLGVELATVRTHLQRFLKKLGTHWELEAAVRAGERGLLQISP